MEYIGVGKRAIAVLIDAVVLFVIGYVIAVATGQTTSTGFSLEGPPAFLWFAVNLLYYIGLEATSGATLGKMALGIRVAKVDGTPMDWPASLIRNILRIVDALFFYLVGAILVWRSPTRQRLGDRVANTVVVKR